MEKYTVFLDETGDHTLEIVDRDFPIFGLLAFIIENKHYITDVVPEAYQLKYKYFTSEGIILHSRDIRKRIGEFSILLNPNTRGSFYVDVNNIMTNSQYGLIACVIHKQEHKERYGTSALNPYDISLKIVMERLIYFCEKNKLKSLHLIAESRGKREDNELRLTFLEILTTGTEYIEKEIFQRVEFTLEFQKKGRNIIGLQLADLAAYPVARYILRPEKENKPFEILKPKFQGGLRYGLKVLP